jgi:hypothetical protein
MAHPANFKLVIVIMTTSLETLDNLKLNFSQPVRILLVGKFQVTFTSRAILSDFHQHRNLYSDPTDRQPDICNSTVFGSPPSDGSN